MYKIRMCYGIIAISAISIVFIAWGFYKAIQFSTGPVNEFVAPVMNNASGSEASRKVVKNPRLAKIFIMGDSIAKGTGDANFKGIAGYLPDLMKVYTSKDIVIDNAGIDGFKSSDFLAQLESGKLNKGIETADIFIISIGGNDLREIQAIRDFKKEQTFQDRQNTYIANVKASVKIIRGLNKDATMIILGLYNPTGLDDNNRYVTTWNYSTQQLFENDSHAVFIPTFDLFKLNMERLLSSDNLHPNSAGYQTISVYISKSIENLFNKR